MNLSDSSRAGKLRLAQWDGPKLLSTGGRPEEVWPRRKILGIFFAPHFGCSTTGNFRAKLQFRKRFAIAKPCFALQFPLENTSVETVTTRELVRSVGRRRVRPSRCRAGSSPSCQPPPQDTGGFWSSPILQNFFCAENESLFCNECKGPYFSFMSL